MNRDEAQKCIRIARKAMSERDFTKAEKFLTKSINLERSQEAQGLLVQCRVLKGSSAHQEPKPASQNKRTQAQQNHKNGKESEPESPKYTPEQERMCKELLKKNTFYDVLGVGEDAKEEEIKKAYKKMALKFHPDRNRAPSATQAFKRISTAYQVVSDPQARQKYDAHGHDQQFEQRYQQQYYSQHMQDPFDIFFSFFGDAAQFGNGARFRQYYEDENGNVYQVRGNQRRPRQQQRRSAQEQQQIKAINACLHYLPFLLIIMVSLLSMLSSLGQADPLYSLSRNSTYRNKMLTKGLKIEYYVADDFNNRIINQYNLNRLEVDIELNLYNDIRSECAQLRRMKKKIARNIYYYTQSDLESVSMKVDEKCGLKQQFYQNFAKRGISVRS